jgi:hypothetical protein
MGDEPYPFDWSGLVPRVVHPLKVAVIEAMAWLGRPLSPSELHEVFERRFSLSLVAYHVNKLEELGALAEIDSRQVRGATEHFYYFAGAK